MDVAGGQLTLTAEDFSRAIADMPENVSARRMLVAYALLMLLAGLGGWLHAAIGLRVVWVVLAIGLIVYRQFRSRAAGAKLISKMKDGERDVSVRFDAEGVSIDTPVSKVSLRYAALHRQIEGSTAFLLYTQPLLAQVVPKRAFDDAQLAQIRLWLAAGVVERPSPKPILRIAVIWAVLVGSFLVVWWWLVRQG